jgi:hypothetical protein
MGSSFNFYNKFTEFLGSGIIDLKTDTIKLMLVTSAYTPSPAHDILADVQTSPDPEVVAIASPDNGYDAGGKALSGQTYLSSDSPAQSVFDADDLTWTALTATFRYGILYAEKTIGSPAIVNPLIGYILFDTTPADKEFVGTDFIVIWNAAGVFTIAEAA